MSNDFIKPVSEHNQITYQKTLDKAKGREIIFDSGCGNGKSSIAIAKLFPGAFIIGIDKSEVRLAKTDYPSPQPNNICLVRADLIDFIRLARKDGIKLKKHFLLYPNPWPKKQHLQRRWHGSPIFPDILALGGHIELRSNWETYLLEFSQALTIAGINSELSAMHFSGNDYLTDFEAKYDQSKHAIWKLTADLNIDTAG